MSRSGDHEEKPSRRRRLLPLGLTGVVGLGLGFWFGPRPEIDETIRPVELPEDLDAYLASTEAEVGDIEPWAVKRIRWADPEAKERTDVALVYLHGFSATHRELTPLPERVADALGANLLLTRLAGHGRRDENALAEPSVNDWLQDGVEALEIGRRLGRRIVVLATSTGATLATWLAGAGHADDVEAMVLFSPNYRLRDRKSTALAWPWGGQLVRWMVGPTRSFEPSTPEQARYWTTRYPTSSLVTLAGLMIAAEGIDDADVSMPVLAIVDPEDRVISPKAVAKRVERFPHPANRVEWFEGGDPSHHILAGEAVSAATTDDAVVLVLNFLRSILEA